MNMALRVKTTMRTAVMTKESAFFMGRQNISREKNSAEKRPETSGRRPEVSGSDGRRAQKEFCATWLRLGVNVWALRKNGSKNPPLQMPSVPPRERFEAQRKPDQSSATRMESTGLEGSYLMLAGWPATRRSRRTWLSRPVMS